MILVTGATGAVGGRVAALLSESGHSTRLMARDPARLPKLPGAENTRGDYADPASLKQAFSGITAAFVVSAYAPPMERAALHNNAFVAAAAAGVKHIVYLSFQGAAADSRFPMGRDHRRSEEYLYAADVPFTILRDNLYMDIIPHLFDATGTVRGPAGSGRTAWVAREDVAQVVAACLRAPPPTNRIMDITGPEALSLSETAARMSALCGRTLAYENETMDAGRAWRSKLGAPEWEVDTWLGSYEAIAAGEVAEVSGAVEEITGRPPFKLEAYFADHKDLLAPLTNAGTV